MTESETTTAPGGWTVPRTLPLRPSEVALRESCPAMPSALLAVVADLVGEYWRLDFAGAEALAARVGEVRPLSVSAVGVLAPGLLGPPDDFRTRSLFDEWLPRRFGDVCPCQQESFRVDNAGCLLWVVPVGPKIPGPHKWRLLFIDVVSCALLTRKELPGLTDLLSDADEPGRFCWSPCLRLCPKDDWFILAPPGCRGRVLLRQPPNLWMLDLFGGGLMWKTHTYAVINGARLSQRHVALVSRDFYEFRLQVRHADTGLVIVNDLPLGNSQCAVGCDGRRLVVAASGHLLVFE